MRPMEEIEYLNAENDSLKKRIKELEAAINEMIEHGIVPLWWFEDELKKLGFKKSMDATTENED